MTKKQERRLNYLCSTQYISLFEKKDFSLQNKLADLTRYEPNSNSVRYKERLELIRLFILLGWSDSDAFDFWFNLSWEQQRRHSEYSKTPIRVRKDNPNLYGQEFRGCGTRRQPRKCRKTAWKRFKKLFPDHQIK